MIRGDNRFLQLTPIAPPPASSPLPKPLSNSLDLCKCQKQKYPGFWQNLKDTKNYRPTLGSALLDFHGPQTQGQTQVI